jgi:hypothetical protein
MCTYASPTSLTPGDSKGTSMISASYFDIEFVNFPTGFMTNRPVKKFAIR